MSMEQQNEGNFNKELLDETNEDTDMEIVMEGSNRHVFQQNQDGDILEELEMFQEASEVLKPADLNEPEIFWPNSVELALPNSKSDKSCANFRRKVNRLKIEKLTPARWNLCGRPHNAYGELEDGTKFCVRYRYPHNFLVAGELLSFRLAVTMRLKSVPCVLLHTVSRLKGTQKNLTKLGWDEEDRTIALIEWVSLKEGAKLPWILLNKLKEGKPTVLSDVATLSKDELALLAQWSDLILFDYLRGEYDRILSLQDEADKQNKPALLEAKIRNTAVDSGNNLWLFDNEAGFLDGYITLYEKTTNRNDLRFQKFHENMLGTLCVFRRSTVLALDHLYQNFDPLEKFLTDSLQAEPLLHTLNIEANERMKYLRENFNQRLTNLIGHFKYCSDVSR